VAPKSITPREDDMNHLAKAAVAAITLCVAAIGASAENYPSRPITLVVPYPPGGTADAMARLLQESLTESLGQQVIVSNRPGAAGTIGSREVARAAPDGYTLLLTNTGPSAVAPVLQPEAGYDPVTDFVAVSLTSHSPMLLVVHPTFPAKDVAELIRLAKEKPGTINYSSAGAGSFGHLSTVLLAESAGIEMVHVPYKGQAPALMAVLNGEVALSLTAPSDAMTQYVRTGRLRLLGVSTLQPSPLAPGAPAIVTVVLNFEADQWFGVTAPAKTSPAIVARLNAALKTALAQPSLQQKFIASGSLAAPSTPEEFQALIAKEAARWKDVIVKSGITLN
jgi:tripartite-type tricarboxylate transporter receptor subunit TctC